jgi:integral membrane sensor domain MASE1
VTIRPTRFAGAVLVVALAHCLGAMFSLQFATVANTTPVWVPAGVDIALLVLLGVRAWPGVLLGDFASTAITGGVPLPVNLAMSSGNALGAALAAAVVLHRTGAPARLRSRADVLVVTLVAAPIAAVVSGAIGISALSLGGVLPDAARGTALRGWTLGDVAGAVVIAPALLALGALRPRLPSAQRAVEAVALLAALTAVSLFAVHEEHDEAYLVFPVLVWAALRFGVRGAAFTSLPLRMVSSYLQLLRRRYHCALDEDADAFIDFAVDGAARMRDLIDDLLTYSRVGRDGIEPVQVDLKSAVAGTLRSLLAAIDDAGATVEVDELRGSRATRPGSGSCSRT